MMHVVARKSPDLWHTLSNVDVSSGTADCAQCGPSVSVRFRPDHRTGKPYAYCRAPLRRANADYQKEWRRSDRGRRILFLSKAKNRHGITAEVFDALVLSQEGRCAICQRPRPDLHIDHSHVTKAVRGLLCPPCNMAIGLLQDDPEIIAAAAAYLFGREG